jgi:transcriptional regulator with XRE-family HTH domain
VRTLREYNELMACIGNRIRSKRKDLMIKQRDLAIAVGISNSYLCDIEKGRMAVTLKVLNRIALQMNVDVKDFM